MKSDNWALRAKHVLKMELKRRGINYSDLADKLAAIGIEENEKTLAKKISRGSFKAGFLLQCLEAIGCDSLNLRHITLTAPADPLRLGHPTTSFLPS